MTGGIGQGLPWWLPEGFLNVEQTLALGERDLVLAGSYTCPVCAATEQAQVPYPVILDPAHIVTKGMGGRPGGSGPTVRICRTHHDLEHFSADGIQRTMAIRETDGAVCWLEARMGVYGYPVGDIEVTVLGHAHPWTW